MAVRSIPVSSTLRLQVQTGTGADGEPVYRLRSFTRVKPEAADEDVYEVGRTLASLQMYPVAAIVRVNESHLRSE
ncbi:MAG: DUF1659 domain-containing protein [Moorellaceae bacterium]